MLRMMFPERRTKRREEALERDALRATLTLEQKLKLCDSRPGESKRERARLLSKESIRIDTQAAVIHASTPKEPPKSDKKAVKARKRKEEAN